MCLNNLKGISKPQKLLEQKIHNLGATNKNFRYKEMFKIFLSKYYDETKNRNKTLDFQLFDKEKNSELNKRITALDSEAFIDYSRNTPIKFETSLNRNATSRRDGHFIARCFIDKNKSVNFTRIFYVFCSYFVKKRTGSILDSTGIS